MFTYVYSVFITNHHIGHFEVNTGKHDKPFVHQHLRVFCMFT